VTLELLTGLFKTQKNMLHPHYKGQPVNTGQRHVLCLVWESRSSTVTCCYGTRYT